MAAERTGRRCVGVEIEPAYVDLSIRRWQKLTGRDAIHAESGHSFNEIASGTSGETSEAPGVPDKETF